MQAYAHAPCSLTMGLPCSTLTAAPSPYKWSVTPTRLLFEAIKDRDLMCCKRGLVGADCLPEGASLTNTMFNLPIADRQDVSVREHDTCAQSAMV